ncbi:MAG: carboxypeptidase Q [Neolewinella sp.]|jgi:carboxypeptidase Q
MTPISRFVIRATLAATACTALVAQDANSQDQIAIRIIKEGTENSAVMQFEDELTHDIGSRLTGSRAFNRAADWAVEQFQEMGLEARLDPWGEWKTGWDREQWMGRVIAPIELELQVACPAWTGGTRGIERGTLVAMPKDEADFDELMKRAGGDEKLWLYGAMPRGALADSARKLLDHESVHGIVQSATSTRWNSKTYKNQIRVFGVRNGGLVPYEDRQRWAQAVVRDDQCEAIETALAGSDPVIIEFELRNRFRKGPIVLNNVVADLVGSEYPDEYVIICAHLDSWHQATGATDNGTGTCSTIEVARILTSIGFKPKRTIRFMLWGGEEQGLLGSRGFVVKNRTAMHKVSAVFNHDSGTNWAHALTIAESHAEDFGSIISPILELMKPPQADHEGPIFQVKPRKVMTPAGGGSDHASFAAVGVPAFSWSLKGHVPYGRGWHSQWDTYSIVEPEFQKHNSTVFAVIAAGVANLDHKLSRKGVERASPGGRGRVDAQLVFETWLGLELDNDAIKSVSEGSIAAKGRLQAGDKILSINGTKVANVRDMLAAMRDAASEKTEVMLIASRSGKMVKIVLRP